MSLGRFGADDEPSSPMAEINTTPMVDVMLVLLVIFIVTAPLLTPAIRLDLPRAEGRAGLAAETTVLLAIDAQGRVYWDGEALGSDEALAERMRQAAQTETPPSLQVRADREVRYERLAIVMAAAQQAGLSKLAFVTAPADAGDRTRSTP
ncbi:MAG: ExbD/TolR family protein [Burkholderiaceae bacterium]